MNSSVQTVALCLVYHWTMVSHTAHVLSTWKPVVPAAIIIVSGRESVSVVTGVCVLYTDDSDGASQRPRSRSVQGSPQLSPMRSLGTEYDVERQGCPRENHHSKNHSRWGNIFPASAIVFLVKSRVTSDFWFYWRAVPGMKQWYHVLADSPDVCLVMFAASLLSSHLIPFFFFSLFDPLLSPHPFRLAFEGQEASHYYQNPREVCSPYKTLPRPPRDPRSMPPTPVMTRNAYSSSQLRCDHCSAALSTRNPSFLPKSLYTFNQTPLITISIFYFH